MRGVLPTLEVATLSANLYLVMWLSLQRKLDLSSTHHILCHMCAMRACSLADNHSSLSVRPIGSATLSAASSPTECHWNREALLT